MFYRARTMTHDHWYQVLTLIMIVLHFGFSAAVLVGGIARFSLPSYQPLLDMVNGRTWIWAAWVGAAAVLMCLPWKWLSVGGLFVGMVWMIFWAAAFALAVAKYPTAAATPVVAYAGFASINAALLLARLMERPREE